MSTEVHFNDAVSTFHGNVDEIEQILVKFKTLEEQSVDNGDNMVSCKELWIRFLELWANMMHLAVKATEMHAKKFESCSDTFRTILVKADVDKLVATDSSVAHKTFFTCLDLLNIPAVHQYLRGNFQNNRPFCDICFINVQYLIIRSSTACTHVSFKGIQLDNYVELFNVLKMNVEKEMPKDASINQHQLHPIAKLALSLFWNMADRTILVPLLIRIGLPASSIQWLANSASLTAKSRRPLISIVHNIARHDDGCDELNRHHAIEIVKAYQNTEAVKKDVKTSLLSSITLAELSTPEQLKKDKKGMNAVLGQLLQLTMDAANNKDYRALIVSFHVSEPLAVLAKLFVVDERTLDYILVHAETEPPSDMTSTIKLFADLLISFSNSITGKDPLDQFTCIALFNIIWSISFQPPYQEELQENTELIRTIKNLANDDGSHVIDQYKPRAMQSIKKAADGILFNLSAQIPANMIKTVEVDKRAGMDDLSIEPSATSLPRRSNGAPHTNSSKTDRVKNESVASAQVPLIMFSYSHGDGEFCRQILNYIEQKKNEFRVWIDFQQCSTGDPWELIADAIEEANVIVCFVSEFYKQSNSCRQEFTYAADDLRKPIVPILMENYKPRGWLGIRKAGMNYIRFRDVKQPKDSEIENLFERIRVELLHHTGSSPSVHVTPPTGSTISPLIHHETLPNLSSTLDKSFDQKESENKTILPPVGQWTVTDIHQWFAQQHLSTRLRDLYQFRSGEEMLEYAQDLVNDKMTQQQTYSKLFGKKYGGDDLPPHEFNRFTRAMDKLLKENSAERALGERTVVSPTKTSSARPTVCVIV